MSAFHDRLMHIARITHYLESIFTEPINYSILFICSGKEGNRIKRNNKMWFIGEISCWARSEIFLRTLVDSIKKDKRIITFTYSEEAYDMLLKDPFNYSKTSIECYARANINSSRKHLFIQDYLVCSTTYGASNELCKTKHIK